ncbi:hypothetical protein QAD02_016384 [Eretmocerus hayati]|uniref:Uncharacterized protein n=1 Tax=Eretmocerus hayati TaxID=131215 RepID=A0ACC2PAY4_9HYME|nr:hypothetical protein QAD02_016384 [Eretmocerus hayati]
MESGVEERTDAIRCRVALCAQPRLDRSGFRQPSIVQIHPARIWFEPVHPLIVLLLMLRFAHPAGNTGLLQPHMQLALDIFWARSYGMFLLMSLDFGRDEVAKESWADVGTESARPTLFTMFCFD